MAECKIPLSLHVRALENALAVLVEAATVDEPTQRVDEVVVEGRERGEGLEGRAWWIRTGHGLVEHGLEGICRQRRNAERSAALPLPPDRSLAS